jgi:hypothetical protein
MPKIHIPAPEPGTTLADWASNWLETRDLAPATRQQYRYLLEKFILPGFGTREVRSLTPEDAAIWTRKTWTGGDARMAGQLLTRMIRDATPMRSRNPIAAWQRRQQAARAWQQRVQADGELLDRVRLTASATPPGPRLAIAAGAALESGVARFRIVRAAMLDHLDDPENRALAMAIAELATGGRCSYPASSAAYQAAAIVQVVTAKEEA